MQSNQRNSNAGWLFNDPCCILRCAVTNWWFLGRSKRKKFMGCLNICWVKESTPYLCVMNISKITLVEEKKKQTNNNNNNKSNDVKTSVIPYGHSLLLRSLKLSELA